VRYASVVEVLGEEEGVNPGGEEEDNDESAGGTESEEEKDDDVSVIDECKGKRTDL
jgi:hypothetical protein